MSPDARAFLLAVIRFQSIRHEPGRPNTREYGLLGGLLADEVVGELRPPFEQRSFRRKPLHVDGLLRTGQIDGPCTVLDVSATGARIRDDGGIGDTALPMGQKLVMRLEPPGSTLRIDMPVEVVHREEATGTFGLSFVGSPLILHQRIKGTRDLLVRDGATDPAISSANDAPAAAAA